MAKIVVLFNHKGGVSKTTTTFNLAWKLTEYNRKVLMVDGDPQCNLTGMFLGENFDEYYEKETTKMMNIKDAVGVAFNGRPQPIEAIDCPVHCKNDKLFMIPGHMDLSEYESSLSLAMNSNNAILTLQNLPGAFYELIRKCCNKYDIDYVLIDMNPGLSSINQTFFVYSDIFIVPTNPDPFSVMALKTLKKTLPRWKKWANQAKDLFAESSYQLPNADMKFLGEIIQRFNLRNQKAAKPYETKINEIKSFVNNDFTQEMKKNDMLVEEKEEYCLGEVPEFGALIQKANDSMVPVYALKKEDMGTVGTIYENMEKKRIVFNEMFSKIAERVMESLE